MEAFHGALQVAAMVEVPTQTMLNGIYSNLNVLGLNPDADVLACAPPAEWRETALETQDAAADAQPAQKKIRVTEDCV